MIRLEITAGLILILATMFIILYVGVSDLTVGLEERTQSQLARSIETGAALFEINCAGCHGQYGQGLQCPTLNTPVLFDTGPDGRISQVGWGDTVESFIRSTITAGRPGTPMVAWSEQFGGPLREDEIQDITNFILNWEPTAGQYPEDIKAAEATPIPEDQLVTVGAELFQKLCATCHAIEGVATGAVGPDLTRIATTAEERAPEAGVESAEAYILQSIVDPNAYIAPECPSGPCPSGVMPQAFGKTLSDDQIKALVAYLLEQK